MIVKSDICVLFKHYIITIFFDTRNLDLDTKIVYLSTLEVKICVDIEFSIIYDGHFVFWLLKKILKVAKLAPN